MVLTALFSTAYSQSFEELEQELAQARSSEEKMSANYQLGKVLLPQDPKRSIQYFSLAFEIASRTANNGMAALSAFQVAEACTALDDEQNSRVWSEKSLSFAKRAGDASLILKSTQKISELERQEGNSQEALRLLSETTSYLGGTTNSIGDLEEKYRRQRHALEQQIRQLESQKSQVQRSIQNLVNADQIPKGSDVAEEVLTPQTPPALETVSDPDSDPGLNGSMDSILQENDQMNRLVEAARQIAATNELKYQELSKEALTQQALLQEARANLAEAQITSERNQYLTLFAGVGLVFLTLLALLSWGRYRASRRAKKELEYKNQLIEEERERSDELLLNILPAEIATELKQNGKAAARQFPEVSVLFSDFKNFTLIAEQLSPEELVDELDRCFKAFDFIISQYPEIEKIKTVGDAYLAASGLTDKKTLPTNLIRAALEMQEFLNEHKEERLRLGKPYFEARIGIHTGPVVAGVVGVNKFAYDIWGDTVNTASRVENQSRPGKVNISESTYRLVKYQFECSYRGKVEVKNKGLLDMYFVEREKASVLEHA